MGKSKWVGRKTPGLSGWMNGSQFRNKSGVVGRWGVRPGQSCGVEKGKNYNNVCPPSASPIMERVKMQRLSDRGEGEMTPSHSYPTQYLFQPCRIWSRNCRENLRLSNAEVAIRAQCFCFRGTSFISRRNHKVIRLRMITHFTLAGRMIWFMQTAKVLFFLVNEMCDQNAKKTPDPGFTVSSLNSWWMPRTFFSFHGLIPSTSSHKMLNWTTTGCLDFFTVCTIHQLGA